MQVPLQPAREEYLTVVRLTRGGHPASVLKRIVVHESPFAMISRPKQVSQKAERRVWHEPSSICTNPFHEVGVLEISARHSATSPLPAGRPWKYRLQQQ
jgi:hypothetical protein